jgi:hypothetical protein
MRTLLPVAALFLVAAAAPAAERVVAADGTSYTRAADGHLYPSGHVRADGSVGTAPVAAPAVPPAVPPAPAWHPPAAPPGPWAPAVVYPGPAYGPVGPAFAPACPNGRCPMPRR